MASLPDFSPHDPDWLAHRHVGGTDTIRFIRVPRAERRAVPFLTDTNLGERTGRHEISVDGCLRDFPQAPLGWLFHSAFCGSTMLVHGFDLPGVSSSLSEPVLLNDVVGLRRRGAPPRDVARLSDVALRVLGRGYPGEAAVIIKPSNVVNSLAGLFLALQPEAPAVFVFAPLETFLISVARKGLQCRLWVRELLEGYLREDFVSLGFEPGDYFRQSDLQVATVGWLAQHACFARLTAQLGKARIALLNADRMIARPDEAVAAVARHFSLGLSAGEVAEIVAGPAFTRNSKSGEVYSRYARADDYATARASYGAEIDTVMLWAERVADNAGIVLDPPGQLLAQMR